MRTLILLLTCAGLGIGAASVAGERIAAAPGVEPTPAARVWVLVEQGAGSTPDALARGEVRAGDTLHVAVQSPVDGYLTMLAFDGADRLVAAGPHNEPRPETRGLWRFRLQVDDQPGREQVVALLGPRPYDVAGMLALANGAPGRVARLVALQQAAGRGEVLPGPEFAHR